MHIGKKEAARSEKLAAMPAPERKRIVEKNLRPKASQSVQRPSWRQRESTDRRKANRSERESCQHAAKVQAGTLLICRPFGFTRATHWNPLRCIACNRFPGIGEPTWTSRLVLLPNTRSIHLGTHTREMRQSFASWRQCSNSSPRQQNLAAHCYRRASTSRRSRGTATSSMWSLPAQGGNLRTSKRG
jgi:hypothetical protein